MAAGDGDSPSGPPLCITAGPCGSGAGSGARAGRETGAAQAVAKAIRAKNHGGRIISQTTGRRPWYR